MSAPEPATSAAPPAPGELCLRGVGKTYGRHRALIDVSATFQPGRVAAILGPNGAGKSTLLGILSTLVTPSTGVLTWGGQALGRGTARRTAIGYVGHDPGVYGDLGARQNLELFAGLYGLSDADARIQRMLDRVGLGEIHTRKDPAARSFSRGMMQRLALARALLPDPELLLFDEPASALDPTGAAWLAREIEEERRAGRLVILVTHDLDAAAAVAGHVVILRRGRVAHDESRPGGFDAASLRALYAERTRA